MDVADLIMGRVLIKDKILAIYWLKLFEISVVFNSPGELPNSKLVCKTYSNTELCEMCRLL